MIGLSQFDYYLPKTLIAQYPTLRRDDSRLMIVNHGKIKEAIFKSLSDYLRAGDLLVFNDVRVIPARLKGKKLDSGGKVDLLLLKEIAGNCWEAKARGSRRLKCGMKISFEEDGLAAEVVEKRDEGQIILKFNSSSDIKKKLGRIGEIPLPPYIKRKVEKIDSRRYQTIFAKYEGAVAAPTAGLHFTPDLMNKLKAKGVDFAFLTLNVGGGTFNPVRREDFTQHRMEAEFFHLPPETAQKINQVRKSHRRLIAVGTTTVRVLETQAQKEEEILPGEGWTNFFIYPGYKFKIVDGILTNFHLPRTTLFLLVCAFLSREEIFEAYALAIRKKYRFYSYGDAMLLFKN